MASACCVRDVRNARYLPKKLALLSQSYQTDFFTYDPETDLLSCKLLTSNPYSAFFHDVYPDKINEDDLTVDMLDVIKSYTDSQSNECYRKTNLNLLSANFDQLDWIYVNKLRSLIRSLNQNNLKHVYYRGLELSDTEIRYYLDRQMECYYTNSFSSFTIDRLLIYPGNAVLILKVEDSNEQARKNLANIWKWSAFSEEKEALLAVGTKLQILSVHFYGGKWQIELELMEDDQKT